MAMPRLHKLLQNIQWREKVEKYDVVPEEREGFLSDEDTAFAIDEKYKRRRSSPRFWTLINLLIMCISIFVNFSHFLADPWKGTSSLTYLNPSDAVKASSYYSPIIKNMDVELHDVRMNGTLWPSKNHSWMRAEPSPEIEEMWEVYEPKDVFSITRDDVVKLGKDPDTVVKFDARFGVGDDAYMASFDMLHKTHCLNELRKMTFEAYGEGHGVKKTHGRMWWVHLRHCVDMLMQDQICHADADVITFNWVDTQDHPWADMSVNRKCRNWDQLLEWGTSRFVEYELLHNFTKQTTKAGEAVQVPFDRGYYDWYGFEGSDLFPNGEGYEW